MEENSLLLSQCRTHQMSMRSMLDSATSGQMEASTSKGAPKLEEVTELVRKGELLPHPDKELRLELEDLLREANLPNPANPRLQG